MKNKNIIIFFVAIIILGLIIWKMPKKEVALPVQDTSETTSSISGATKNTKGDFTYTREGEFSSIEAIFPSKTTLAHDADIQARTTMENWIKQRESEFLTNANEMIDVQEQARLKEQGTKYALGIEYKMYTGDVTVSYVYQIYEDTGGAHPNVYYTTFTFDQSGKKLELADLFKPSVRYLDALSGFAYTDISAQSKKRFESDLDEGQIDWIKNGTSPSPETLQFFYVDGQNLVLIFPPYQVAPYAAGVFESKIPFAKLKDILK